MPQEYLRAVLQEDQKVNQLFTFLGARVAAAEDGAACVLLPVSSKLAQGGGMVAGQQHVDQRAEFINCRGCRIHETREPK